MTTRCGTTLPARPARRSGSHRFARFDVLVAVSPWNIPSDGRLRGSPLTLPTQKKEINREATSSHNPIRPNQGEHLAQSNEGWRPTCRDGRSSVPQRRCLAGVNSLWPRRFTACEQGDRSCSHVDLSKRRNVGSRRSRSYDIEWSDFACLKTSCQQLKSAHDDDGQAGI